MRGQQFLVDARLVIVALQVGGGDQLDQIPVAGLILRQQHQVVVGVPPARARLLLQAAARRHVNLAADDRLDALLPRRAVKIDRPIHHPVVGDRQRAELQGMRLVHQPVQPARPVEQRILGVQM